MLICDAESNGFLNEVNRLWLIAVYDTNRQEWHVSFDQKVFAKYPCLELLQLEIPDKRFHIWTHETLIKEVLNGSVFCFHNWYGYDRFLFQKLGYEITPKYSHDSLILSQLFNPDRFQGHGLEGWGRLFKRPKPKYEEWDKFSPEMLHRVIEDVRINTATWFSLMKEKEDWEKKGHSWKRSIKLEYEVADLIGRQERQGVLLDEEGAYGLADELWTEVQKVDETLIERMPMQCPELPIVAYEDEPFTKARKLKSSVIKWFHGEEVVWGEFCRVEYNPVNLNSYEQIKSFLLTQGWRPTEYTEKGSPQLTEDSFVSIKGNTGQLIAKRAVLKHRAQTIFNINKKGQLKGWLNLVREDNRLEAGAWTNGTNTGRMRHRVLVNVPKPKDNLWSSKKQLRSLITVPEGRVMMGIDADGLEARVMCHWVLPYKGGQEYADIVLNGDIHAVNADIFEIDTSLPSSDRRDESKPAYYCLMYGGQYRKLADTLGCSERKGKILFDKFWRESTALWLFRESITKYWKSTGGKYILGIDGRRINTRSEHSLVNACFQSTGSIIVKKASVLCDQWVRDEGLDANQIIHYHDEFEYECSEADAPRVGELASIAMEEAGRFYKMRVPITGTPKFGETWEEVH